MKLEEFYLDKDFISPDIRKIVKKVDVTPQRGAFILKWKLSKEYVRNMKQIPGFRFSWYYTRSKNGLKQIVSHPKYAEEKLTKSFIRNLLLINTDRTISIKNDNIISYVTYYLHIIH